jgi:hypothetical protein
MPQTGNWSSFSTKGRCTEGIEIFFETLEELHETDNVELNIELDEQHEYYYDETLGGSKMLDLATSLELIGATSNLVDDFCAWYARCLRKIATGQNQENPVEKLSKFLADMLHKLFSEGPHELELQQAEEQMKKLEAERAVHIVSSDDEEELPTSNSEAAASIGGNGTSSSATSSSVTAEQVSHEEGF